MQCSSRLSSLLMLSLLKEITENYNGNNSMQLKRYDVGMCARRERDETLLTCLNTEIPKISEARRRRGY